MRGFRNKH